jgi:hypothetical protein
VASSARCHEARTARSGAVRLELTSANCASAHHDKRVSTRWLLRHQMRRNEPRFWPKHSYGASGLLRRSLHAPEAHPLRLARFW